MNFVDVQILPLLEHQLIELLHELDLEGYGYGFCYEVPWKVFCDGFCGYFARYTRLPPICSYNLLLRLTHIWM